MPVISEQISPDKEHEELFCVDLPSTAQPEMGRILVTGASGYIGGRLVPELLARGYQVRAMVRASSPEYATRWPRAEIVVADALEPSDLKSALQGVHTAYYLIHSLLLGPEEFSAADIQAAVNFREAAGQAGIKRVIYLGGLGDTLGPLSEHLKSRIRIAEELAQGTVPVTVLRAAIIIGSGSASYEIIKDLVNKLWLILIPYWARNKCQPIAVRDVIKYLVGVLETPATAGKRFDIGGADILSYEEMMRIVAGLLQKKRFLLHVPSTNIRFFAYVASLFTPVPAPITLCLMEGLASEVVCQDQAIKRLLPFEPLTYRQAIVKAMSREEQDRVSTRWSDAYPPAHELALKLHEIDKPADYTANYSMLTEKEASALFRSICMIGGKEGWFQNNWMWRLRGKVDRILLGVGASRGRRSFSSLAINDVIDFWRVEDFQPDRKLLLRAEMKLPGKAWLEFTITPQGTRNVLATTAYYYTSGILGRLYWYIFLPFHSIIFKNLIEQIEKRS